ncbi:Lipopolysaccharide O-side chain biosynthesis protein (O-antigen transpoter) [Planktothrix tepida]|uniref:Lipopolysaccharide O-side chain biosynthesis protein (O-antigen transpoter) n=2 Tax=Planktothrix TaxID=54304 RepID=A0A1J1LLS2_9CYAN|nr:MULTISPECIES: oligosaccharide flippase family protein [Planktothrix]CAD5936297.1 Lipopolysaccharide O-side chain biosynthesis protein (O-antigen transpoter) [Planktothrix tepida]CAD5975228.1 Lipopolysaccharide O-side chain biosynthesis protein (O-antigen transpoter) [Planktothrix pseudagardhii]CUR33411.1 Lipopolysaccharide O-side chain biosynthesis protein (O-antigen transpoter) [Planktothrix tepida PCC 9214]
MQLNFFVNQLRRLDWSYLYAFLGEATLALTFVFYIAIARVLGPAEYGVFAAAIALAAILSLFIQFGFPTLINREVAANPVEGPKYTIRFLLLEGLTSIPVLLLLLPLALVLGYEGNGLIVCYLAVFSEIARAAKLTLRGTLKGMGWFRAESISVAIERSAVVLISTAVLFLTHNLVFVVGTIVIVRFLDILGLLYFLNRKVNLWSSLNFNTGLASLKIAYPFAMSGLLWVLYYQVDLVMIKGMGFDDQAGLYSASYRILEIFSALPRVIFYVIFTRLARYHVSEPHRVPEQIYKATRLLLVGVLPILLVAISMQGTLVEVLYGAKYSGSVASLRILLSSLSVSMFGVFTQNFLQATGREHFLPRMLFLTASINIFLNTLLIPQWGAAGAAFATLMSEIILCSAGFTIMIREGYQRSTTRLAIIVICSLILTMSPSFLLMGLSPVIGIGLIGISLITILFLMQPKQFLGTSLTQ